MTGYIKTVGTKSSIIPRVTWSGLSSIMNCSTRPAAVVAGRLEAFEAERVDQLHEVCGHDRLGVVHVLRAGAGLA